MEKELYDGEYFIQKIQVNGLNAPRSGNCKIFWWRIFKGSKRIVAKRRAKISIWQRLFIGWRIGCLDRPDVRTE